MMVPLVIQFLDLFFAKRQLQHRFLCLWQAPFSLLLLFYQNNPHFVTSLSIRGVRPIERALEQQCTPENQAIGGYCLAVRASLTDDGRSPLQPSGLKLFDRITQIHASIARVQEKKASTHLKAVAASPEQGIANDSAAVAALAALL
jgi:hypothetical protein